MLFSATAPTAMARTKHLVKRSRTKPSVEAGPSTNPSTPTRKSTRIAPITSVQKSKQEKLYKPGTMALREIKHFQKTWNLVIPAAPFIRHVREVSHFFAPEVTRWQAEALIAIQEAAEDFLVRLFENAMLCAIHAKRVTLMKKILTWLDDLEEKDILGEALTSYPK